MLHVRRPGALVAALLTTTLTAAACGGGDDGGGEVASLSGDDGTAEDGTTDTTLSDDELEDALLDWTECMRGEGFDLPDPTVDEDGDLTLGGGPGGPGGGGEDGPDDGGEGERPDREAVEAAEEVCGQPPPGAFGGGGEVDQEAMQESALAFAECMRDQGIDDFPDPDLSDMGPGAGPPPDDGSAEDGGGGGGGPFDDVDMDDPDVRAAMETCQGELGDLRGGPGGGGGGDEGSDDEGSEDEGSDDEGSDG